MPQLDKITLFSQVVCVLFLFFSFFVVFVRFYLPNVSKLFKFRLSVVTMTARTSTHLRPVVQLQGLFKQIVGVFRSLVKLVLNAEHSTLVQCQLKFFTKVTSFFFTSCAKHIFKLHFYSKLLK